MKLQTVMLTLMFTGLGRTNLCDGGSHEPNNSNQHSSGDLNSKQENHIMKFEMRLSIPPARFTYLFLIVQDAVEGLMKQAADEVDKQNVFNLPALFAKTIAKTCHCDIVSKFSIPGRS